MIKRMKLSTNYLIVLIFTTSLSMMFMFTDVFKNKWILSLIGWALLIVFGLVLVTSIYNLYKYKNNAERIVQFKNEITDFYIDLSRLLVTLVFVIYLIDVYVAWHLNELHEIKMPAYTYITYMLMILLTHIPKIMELEKNNESNMSYIDFLKTINNENIARNDSLKNTVNESKKKINAIQAENLKLVNKFNTLNSLVNSRNHKRINRINRKNKIVNIRKLRH